MGGRHQALAPGAVCTILRAKRPADAHEEVGQGQAGLDLGSDFVLRKMLVRRQLKRVGQALTPNLRRHWAIQMRIFSVSKVQDFGWVEKGVNPPIEMGKVGSTQ